MITYRFSETATAVVYLEMGEGMKKHIIGGGYNGISMLCRAACRRRYYPGVHYEDLGFRVMYIIPRKKLLRGGCFYNGPIAIGLNYWHLEDYANENIGFRIVK